MLFSEEVREKEQHQQNPKTKPPNQAAVAEVVALWPDHLLQFSYYPSLMLANKALPCQNEGDM